jgi:hypothetical protein
MKQPKCKIKAGDIVYYETPNGIESAVVMMRDGHEITTSDYGYLNIRKCLPEDDPRVVEYKKKIKEDASKQEE